MSETLTGQCLCASVSYEVPDEFKYALICHCSQCRRATGSANKPFAGIEFAKLQVKDGQASILRSGQGPNHDVRCGKCGSLLYSVVRDGAYVHVALGSLIDAPSIKPTDHIFVGSKAGWESITDGLPQHDEM
jgi:hypothetical protein